MNRETINRATAIAPAFMSVLALAIALTSVTTGWERLMRDEGTAAHLFQFLIALQVPLVLTFLATSDWDRLGKIARTILMQVAALALALSVVAYFKL